MECHYKEINVIEDTKRSTTGNQWRPFFRQLLVSSTVWTIYFGTGLCLGAPTVFIPQLRSEANSTDAVSDDMASWLSSVFGFTALPWVFILPALVRLIGRKKTFTIICFNNLAMFVPFYLSVTPEHLLYSELLQGITHGSCITIPLIVITEYTSPKYRGLFLTIKAATVVWGMWVSNYIGTFFHWRYIPLFGIICSIYPVTAIFFWPESPYWLASKGSYHKCAYAHRWLKGTDENSEKELENLIDLQMKCTKKENLTLKSVTKTLRLKQFYMPMGLSILLVSQYHFSGKFVCSIYSIEIIKRITNNESMAYIGMLILDGVTVFSMYVGCGLTSIMKRRTLLLISATIGIIFLFVLSIYLYLVKLNVIEENKYLSILFLSCFSLSISVGPMLLPTTISGELIPLRFKSTSVIIMALIFNILDASLLKIAPYIFNSFGMHGTFLFYGISVAMLTIAIYKYLPETKDKTLQEIEEYFMDKSELASGLVKRDKKNELIERVD